jgi:hypothetical protein
MGNVPTGFWDAGNLKALGGASKKVVHTIKLLAPTELIIHNKDYYMTVKSVLRQNGIKYEESSSTTD